MNAVSFSPTQDDPQASIRLLSLAARGSLYPIPIVLLIAANLGMTWNGLSASFLILAAIFLLTAVVAHGFGALLRAQGAQTDVLNRLEGRLTDGFKGLSEAFGNSRAEVPVTEAKLLQIAQIRLAIRQGHWADAQQLVLEFGDTHPDDHDLERLTKELDEAREHAGRDLLAKIDAAREVNDPERVIELREAIQSVVESEKLRDLDRDLAKWFIALIHRRLRTGTVRSDVAILAARVAAILDETPEGASLRASLPTLRRAAGLCARCGQPYTGVADACPACMAGALGGPGFVPGGNEVDPDEEFDQVEPSDEFGIGQLGD